MSHRRTPYSVRIPQNLSRLLTVLGLSPQAFLKAALEDYLKECPYLLALCERQPLKKLDHRADLEAIARRIWQDRHALHCFSQLQGLRKTPMRLIQDEELAKAVDS